MVFALTSWIAPSAAWSMLRRHAADDVGALKLVDLKLVKHDDDDYVAVHRSSNTVGDNSSAVRERNSGDGGDDGSHLLIVDWSRQRMTNDTMGHLMSLSVSMEIKEKILDLAWGKLAPHSKLQSKLPQGDRGTFDQHLLPYNRQHDNGGKPKTTFDGFGRRKPWTPDCIDDQFGNDNDSNDSNDDDEMGFEVTFNEQLALHNNTQEQRSIDKQNVTKLNSATRKYFEDQRRYDIVESNIRNNDDHDNDAIVDTNTTSENNGNKSGGSMHLAYRAPANKGLFMRDPYSNDKRKNVLDDIHNEWKRIQHITNNIRKGTTRGAMSGRPICGPCGMCWRGRGRVGITTCIRIYLPFIRT